MRERTTWTRDNTKAAAGTDASGKSAATNRTADPYAMNQDHLGQQPKADKYLTGDPSTFAEDITEPNTWDREYEGGATKRDEIGMPAFRPETFTHAEKTASMDEATLIKKAKLCAFIASTMLKGRKFATEAAAVEAVESQSVALMYLPNADLIQTASRLATEEDFPGGQFPQDGHQEQAAPQEPTAVSQCVQALQSGDMAGVQAGIQAMVTAALKVRKAAEEQQQQQQQQQQQAVQEQQQVQQGQGQQQQAVQEGQAPAQGQQQEQQALEQMLSQAIESADYDAKKGPAVNPPGYGTGPKMARGVRGAEQQQQQQQQGQQAQQQQAPQQAPQEQQAQQQQVAPQGQQQQQQAVQQVPVVQAPTQQQQQADDMLLDDMLSGPNQGQGMSEMDIEMESPTMDTGEIVLSATDDEVLKTLFATQESQDAEQAQQEQQSQQQKQAGMSRTASANPSTRTIGTRPTVGVSKVGGAQTPRTGSDVNSLSNLWASAPDVREAFGIR